MFPCGNIYPFPYYIWSEATGNNSGMNIFIHIIFILSGFWGDRVSEIRSLGYEFDHVVLNCLFLKSTEIYYWKDVNSFFVG